MTSLREATSEKAMCGARLEVEESCQAVNFMSVSREGPTHKVLVKLSVWQKVMLLYNILYPYYISSLPMNCKECYSESKP